MRQIVDVLGSAGKVNEFGHLHDFRIAGQTLLDPVLERLHVVVGNRLDFLDLGGLRRTEVADQLLEFGHGCRRERRNFRKMRFRDERLEPLDLDLQAATDQTEFRELRTQGIDLPRVTAIQWR